MEDFNGRFVRVDNLDHALEQVVKQTFDKDQTVNSFGAQIEIGGVMYKFEVSKSATT